MKTLSLVLNDNKIEYPALAFICPGCVAMMPGASGLHLLPVNTNVKSPSWEWDKNLILPTLSPSIKTRSGKGVCHSFLRGGVFEFLNDCTHALKGQFVNIPDLPEWYLEERNGEN